MTELSGSPGFAPPLAGKKLSRRRAVALELVATVTLTISLVVAATAVSLGNRSLVERPSAAAPAAPLDRARAVALSAVILEAEPTARPEVAGPMTGSAWPSAIHDHGQ